MGGTEEGRSGLASLSARDIREMQLTRELAEGIEMAFVLVPAGRFVMGSPEVEQGRHEDEGPQLEVRIAAPFYLGMWAVTQAQYEVVMGENPSHFKEGLRPVECMAWEDAQRFCQKASAIMGQKLRLPAESEWEYACRAGTTTRYYSGDLEEELARAGWFEGNSGGQTHAVGQKEGNAFGLCDMHGNVWEWCEDDWHEGHKGAASDGRARMQQPRGDRRVMRGGSCFVSAQNCRSACRCWGFTGFRDVDIGFRVVLDSK